MCIYYSMIFSTVYKHEIYSKIGCSVIINYNITSSTWLSGAHRTLKTESNYTNVKSNFIPQIFTLVLS